MFDKGFIQQLKQSNISVDTEKSKERLAAVWKSAGRADQSTVLALSGVARASVQRAYKTGSVSAKLVIALGQTFRLSPRYLTGESDEPGEFTEAEACELLSRHGYNKLLAAYAGGMGRQHRRMPYGGAEVGPQGGVSADAEAMADELTEDDMVLLLRSALLRARAGGHYADVARKLKLLMLS